MYRLLEFIRCRLVFLESLVEGAESCLLLSRAKAEKDSE